MPERVVRFPEDRSLGALRLYDADNVTGFMGAGGETYGDARGAVTIATGKALTLWVGSGACTRLAVFENFGPNDIQAVHLRARFLTDPDLVHLISLAGLKFLDLSYTQITDAGLAALAALTELEVLDLSPDTRTTGRGRKRLEQAILGCAVMVW